MVLMQSPDRREIAIGLMPGLEENLEWFPRYQASLQEHRPPTQSFEDPFQAIEAGRRIVRHVDFAARRRLIDRVPFRKLNFKPSTIKEI